jgi:L-alanine-DL-glutamate epimerase-like enolase superfamily enzyme
MGPTITSVEVTEFTYDLPDRGYDPRGFNVVYDGGNSVRATMHAFRIETDVGVTGTYVGGNDTPRQFDLYARSLIGEDALARERHWNDVKRALRKRDRMGMGPVDIALWDLAGKHHGVAIHELLGTYRERLPTYASTYHGDTNGGLDSPAAMADFAEMCRDIGYPAVKLHGWSASVRDIDREVAAVHAVGERVGEDVDLMLDPACEYETFADALAVGEACDAQNFLWYEDPYRDGGLSSHAHRKLREHLETPLLMGEHVRGLEAMTDVVDAGATDFVRADPEYDAGITGAMKRARMAEAHGLDVEIHGCGPAQRHCMAATPNTNYYELNLVHPDCPNTTPPVYAGGYEDELHTVEDDGCVGIPDGPGLGVEYDWDRIRELATDRTVHE